MYLVWAIFRMIHLRDVWKFWNCPRLTRAISKFSQNTLGQFILNSCSKHVMMMMMRIIIIIIIIIIVISLFLYFFIISLVTIWHKKIASSTNNAGLINVNYSHTPSPYRDAFRTTATSEMEPLVTMVNSWKPLTIVRKNSIPDIAVVPNTSLPHL